jgi:hypothetical protein
MLGRAWSGVRYAVNNRARGIAFDKRKNIVRNRRSAIDPSDSDEAIQIDNNNNDNTQNNLNTNGG